MKKSPPMKTSHSLLIFTPPLVSMRGMEFERMEQEIKELKEKISSSKPVCPFCLVEMKAIDYRGYYDSFCFWECACEKFDKPDEKSSGQYA
jgi:hypothetical protein